MDEPAMNLVQKLAKNMCVQVQCFLLFLPFCLLYPFDSSLLISQVCESKAMFRRSSEIISPRYIEKERESGGLYASVGVHVISKEASSVFIPHCIESQNVSCPKQMLPFWTIHIHELHFRSNYHALTFKSSPIQNF